MDAPSNVPPLRGCLQRIAADGEKTAFILSTGEHWTYQQTRDAFTSASPLGLTGKVGILVEDRYLAGPVAGAVMNATTCVPLDPKLTPSELKDRIALLEIKTIVAQSAKWKGLETPGFLHVRSEKHQLIWEGKAAPAEASDAALILMTSGSTGAPKLVALSHHNLDHSASAIIDSLALGPDDRAVNLLPMMHIGGLFDLFFVPLISGGSIAFAEPGDPKAIVSILENQNPTWLQGAPAMLQNILRHQGEEKIKHQLRFIRSVSAPLPDKLYSKISNFFGVPVIEMYGMSETAGLITSNPLPPRAQKIGSVGVPVNCEIEIRNDNEIWVNSQGLFAGYARGEDNDGLWDNEWFFTGDLGSLDDDGYLFLNGRAKEVINRGGQKVSPREIDEPVESWPEVKEAAAFGFEHPTLGEEIGLALVFNENATLTDDEIRARLSEKLATYKLPKRLLHLDSLPRNQSGKLQRHFLGDHKEETTALKKESLSPTEERIKKFWCAALGEDSARPRDDFFEQGGDSLSATTLLVSLEKEFKISLAGFIFYENSTIRKIATHLESQRGVTTSVEKRSIDFSPRIRKRLGNILASWPGAPAFPGSYARMAPEPRDDIPKFFWCCNGVGESTGITAAVGGFLEVVSFRTLRSVQNKKLRNLNQIARVYADDIQRIQPDGPLILGGFCEGGRLMVLTARVLIEQGRTIQLLVLHDHLLFESLDAHLALIYSESWKRYPPKFNADIHLGWRKLHQGRYAMISRAGRHGYENNRELTEALHDFIKEQLTVSADSPKKPTALQSPNCSVELRSKLPFFIKTNRDYQVKVRIRNHSDKPLVAGAGVLLHARWIDLNCAEKFGEPMWTHLTDDLAPGESQNLEISIKGLKRARLYQVQIAVIEEGFGWNAKPPNKSFRRWKLIR